MGQAARVIDVRKSLRLLGNRSESAPDLDVRGLHVDHQACRTHPHSQRHVRECNGGVVKRSTLPLVLAR